MNSKKLEKALEIIRCVMDIYEVKIEARPHPNEKMKDTIIVNFSKATYCNEIGDALISINKILSQHDILLATDAHAGKEGLLFGKNLNK